MIPKLLLAGLIVLTAGATVGALVVWHRSYRSYRSYLGRGSRVAMLSVAPLTLLAASPLVDVTVWVTTGVFPTIGLAGPVAGLAGVTAAVAYVSRDLRGEVSAGDHPALLRGLVGDT